MRLLSLSIVVFLCGFLAPAQAIYRTFASEALQQDRNIKVLPPRNYEASAKKKYPLIIVLDGDYLFEPVAGTVDYLSYWGQMPECLVVGINQNNSRNNDCAVETDTGLPQDVSRQFMDFVLEVKNTLAQEYRLAPFTLMVGKDVTANLSAFYLMQNEVPVQAMLHIEPQFTEIIKDNLVKKIRETKSFYGIYAASSKKEATLDEVFNEDPDGPTALPDGKVLRYEPIAGTNKYDVAAQAIPLGLKFLFNEFAILDAATFENKDKSKTIAAPLDQLKEKYKKIEKMYGIDMPVRLVDLVTIAEYFIKKKKWESLLEVSEVARKSYPDLLYGRFIEGMAQEGLGNPSRAIKAYNAAYVLAEAVGIDKNMVLDKIEYLQTKQ